MTVSLAIIVPTLNEAGRIGTLLAALTAQFAAADDRPALLVVDGGSHDGTPALAAAQGARVIGSEPGRAQQMNAGAAAAGDVAGLWFLHADSALPDNALSAVMAALQGGAAWGRFDVRISGRHWMLRLIARGMNARSRLTGIATGDQGLFISRCAFEAVGGYPIQPLMEDIAITRRLRARVGPPMCLRGPLITSGRRWERAGVWRTVALMAWLRWCYWCGADPARLARHYRPAEH